MAICPTYHKYLKTTQGLSAHMRLRHQITIPKQDFPIYARERVEKAEDENARLREKVGRLERRLGDRETFFDQQIAAQKEAQERAVAEQQKAALKQLAEQKAESEKLKQAEQTKALLKQLEDQRAESKKRELAALQKQIEDLAKKIEQYDRKKTETFDSGKIDVHRTPTMEMGESSSYPGRETRDNRNRELGRFRGPPSGPPRPHPLRPIDSIRRIKSWFFDE